MERKVLVFQKFVPIERTPLAKRSPTAEKVKEV